MFEEAKLVSLVTTVLTTTQTCFCVDKNSSAQYLKETLLGGETMKQYLTLQTYFLLSFNDNYSGLQCLFNVMESVVASWVE